MLNKILYPELSYKITGICFQIQNELSRFAKEIQYAQRMEQLLGEYKINFVREARQPYRIGEIKVSGNITDFIIEGKIIVELKAKPIILKNDYFQTQRYLAATDLELGLLVNFRDRYLKPKE